MRKIETQMNTAIRRGKDFRSGNTEVNAFTCGATGRLGSIVKLHGNKIAEVFTLSDSGVHFSFNFTHVCSVCCLYNSIINDLPEKSTSRMLRKD